MTCMCPLPYLAWCVNLLDFLVFVLSTKKTHPKNSKKNQGRKFSFRERPQEDVQNMENQRSKSEKNQGKEFKSQLCHYLCKLGQVT